MTTEILEWLARTRQWVTNPRRVLEVGSRDVNGTPRTHYAVDGVEYIGVDIESGPGVDQIRPCDRIGELGHFDVVVCCEMLEHVPDPFGCVGHLRAAVADGGFLIVTSPAPEFPLHRHPRDYVRLMPDFYTDVIFRDMVIHDIHRTTDPCWCYLGQCV